MLPAPLGCGLASLPCLLLTSSFTNISRVPFHGAPTTGQSSPLSHQHKVISCVPPSAQAEEGACGSVVGGQRGAQKLQLRYTKLPLKLVTPLRQCGLSVEVSGDEKYLGSCRQSLSLRNIPHFHLLPSHLSTTSIMWPTAADK